MSSILSVISSEFSSWLDAIVFRWPGRIGNRLRAARLASQAATFGKGCYVEKGCLFRGVKNMSFGSRVSVGLRSCFYADNGTLQIGDKTSFNSNVHINASIGGTISIGSDCLLGPNVVIHSANHQFSRNDVPVREQGHVIADVIIEDNVWIGANAVIVAGVRIGTGAIVAAGAVVIADVEPYTLVGGVPAKLIRRR